LTRPESDSSLFTNTNCTSKYLEKFELL
jgi:hypothetical protein